MKPAGRFAGFLAWIGTLLAGASLYDSSCIVDSRGVYVDFPNWIAEIPRWIANLPENIFGDHDDDDD